MKTESILFFLSSAMISSTVATPSYVSSSASASASASSFSSSAASAQAVSSRPYPSKNGNGKSCHYEKDALVCITKRNGIKQRCETISNITLCSIEKEGKVYQDLTMDQANEAFVDLPKFQSTYEHSGKHNDGRGSSGYGQGGKGTYISYGYEGKGGHGGRGIYGAYGDEYGAYENEGTGTDGAYGQYYAPAADTSAGFSSASPSFSALVIAAFVSVILA